MDTLGGDPPGPALVVFPVVRSPFEHVVDQFLRTQREFFADRQRMNTDLKRPTDSLPQLGVWRGQRFDSLRHRQEGRVFVEPASNTEVPGRNGPERPPQPEIPKAKHGRVAVVDRRNGQRIRFFDAPPQRLGRPVPSHADESLQEIGHCPGVTLVSNRPRPSGLMMGHFFRILQLASAADEKHAVGRGFHDELFVDQRRCIDARLSRCRTIADDDRRPLRPRHLPDYRQLRPRGQFDHLDQLIEQHLESAAAQVRSDRRRHMNNRLGPAISDQPYGRVLRSGQCFHRN